MRIFAKMSFWKRNKNCPMELGLTAWSMRTKWKHKPTFFETSTTKYQIQNFPNFFNRILKTSQICSVFQQLSSSIVEPVMTGQTYNYYCGFAVFKVFKTKLKPQCSWNGWSKKRFWRWFTGFVYREFDLKKLENKFCFSEFCHKIASTHNETFLHSELGGTF